MSDTNDYSRCPACNEWSDICCGHGKIGELILDNHNNNDHRLCHPAADCKNTTFDGYTPCNFCGAEGSSEDHTLDNGDGACPDCQDIYGNTQPQQGES